MDFQCLRNQNLGIRSTCSAKLMIRYTVCNKRYQKTLEIFFSEGEIYPSHKSSVAECTFVAIPPKISNEEYRSRVVDALTTDYECRVVNLRSNHWHLNAVFDSVINI
jgi:hypothetical protein